jgi:hypothetical protein
LIAIAPLLGDRLAKGVRTGDGRPGNRPQQFDDPENRRLHPLVFHQYRSIASASIVGILSNLLQGLDQECAGPASAERDKQPGVTRVLLTTDSHGSTAR